MSKCLPPSIVLIPTHFADDPNISAATLSCIAYCYANPDKDFHYLDFEKRFGFSGETAKEVFVQLQQLGIISID